MDPLLTKLRAEEARKKDLIKELEQLAGVDQITVHSMKPGSNVN